MCAGSIRFFLGMRSDNDDGDDRGGRFLPPRSLVPRIDPIRKCERDCGKAECGNPHDSILTIERTHLGRNTMKTCDLLVVRTKNPGESMPSMSVPIPEEAWSTKKIEQIVAYQAQHYYDTPNRG